MDTLFDNMYHLIDFMDPHIDVMDSLIDSPCRFHGSPHTMAYLIEGAPKVSSGKPQEWAGNTTCHHVITTNHNWPQLRMEHHLARDPDFKSRLTNAERPSFPCIMIMHHRSWLLILPSVSARKRDNLLRLRAHTDMRNNDCFQASGHWHLGTFVIHAMLYQKT